MGGLIIEEVRPGVRFIPDAADAFRRADAQVRAEFGRGIDVNSTFRSWDTQLGMHNAWNRYVNSGRKPALYPGHSKAVHPSESFHVDGEALDSDDWVIQRIVEILAENGFIRNRLHVSGENHHFEWIRARDRNFGKPFIASTTTPTTESEEDDMLYLLVDDDGNKKPVWVLLNTRTAKFLTVYEQARANGWATAWGTAKKVTRQEFLNAIDAIRSTN